MKTSLLTLFCFSLLSYSIHGQATLDWGKSLGGANNDIAHRIAYDMDGNVIVAGTFRQTVDFDNDPDVTVELTAVGDFSSFVCKLDPDGDLIWVFSLGGHTSVSGLYVDPTGHIFIGGSYNNTTDFDGGPVANERTSFGLADVYIAKYESTGELMWVNTFGDTNNDNLGDLTVDQAGSVYATGNFYGTIDVNPGIGTSLIVGTDEDAYVVKYDGSGNLAWGIPINGTEVQDPTGLDVDDDYNIYISGYFTGKTDFNYANPDVDTLRSFSPGEWDSFVLKLGPPGNFLWVKQFGGNGGDTAYDLQLDAANNIYVTGYFEDTADFDPGTGVSELVTTSLSDVYVMKLENDGDLNWVKAMGGTSPDVASEIALDNAGNIYTVGLFGDDMDMDPGSAVQTVLGFGSSDFYVSKLTNDGNYVWGYGFGTINQDQAQGLAADNSGNVYIAGFHEGTIDIDPTSGMAYPGGHGNRDALVIKLHQSSTIYINELNNNAQASVYPNPMKDGLTIFTNNNAGRFLISITDANGKLVHCSTHVGNSCRVNDLDIEAGIYFVNVLTENSSSVVKVIRD